MRKGLLLLAGMVLLMPLTVSAQEIYPKAEVFGGYSYLRTNVTDVNAPPLSNGFFPAQDYNLHGWNTSVSANLTSWLGLVGDFSGHYDLSEAARNDLIVGTNYHSFLFGPRFTARSGRFNPFVHALFGAARGSYDYDAPFGDITNTKFAMALGGGIDVGISDSFAVRLIQADYMMTRFGADNSGIGFDDDGGARQNNLRLGAGIIFRIR